MSGTGQMNRDALLPVILLVLVVLVFGVVAEEGIPGRESKRKLDRTRSVSGCDTSSGVPYLKILAIQSLDPPDRTQGKAEAITARAPTMGLTGEGGRRRCAGGLQETSRSSREAHVVFGEM